jgi:hypothetical protein
MILSLRESGPEPHLVMKSHLLALGDVRFLRNLHRDDERQNFPPSALHVPIVGPVPRVRKNQQEELGPLIVVVLTSWIPAEKAVLACGAFVGWLVTLNWYCLPHRPESSGG